MRCVESNKSKNSGGADTSLFPLMFPDSKVAQKFQLGRTKLSYMISYGLVPYFRDILDKQLTSCDNFRISFDEAFNDVSQKKPNGYHRKILRQKQERNRYPLLQLVFSWTDYSWRPPCSFQTWHEGLEHEEDGAHIDGRAKCQLEISWSSEKGFLGRRMSSVSRIWLMWTSCHPRGYRNWTFKSWLESARHA